MSGTPLRRVLGVVALAAAAWVSVWLLAPDGSGHGTSDASQESSTVPAQAAPPPESPGPSSPASVPSPGEEPEREEGLGEEPELEEGDESGHGEGELVDPTAPVVPRDAAHAERLEAYARAAEKFLTAFARPAAGVSGEEWWSRVRPLLVDVAQDAYAGTDPRSVPFTRVTGPATILPTDAPSGLLVLARVPTDGGFYRVEMITVSEGIRVSRATAEEAGA